MRDLFTMQQSIAETIKKRVSCRTFCKTEIEANQLTLITDYINKLNDKSESAVKLWIVRKKDLAGQKIKLGTYGFIKGAEVYICGSWRRSDVRLEWFGYVMQQVILFVSNLGLGSCWMGGTFKRAEFAKTENLSDAEFIPAISPIGYAADKTRPADRLVRRLAGSEHRKDWKELFFKEGFHNSLNLSEANDYANALEMLRLAPSASNKQPWRIVQQDDFFHFFVCRKKGYGKLLGYDIQRLDIGIAMYHFQAVAAKDDLKGKWLYNSPRLELPDSQTKYIISWQKS